MAADIWFGAIITGLVLYVVLDGNDLGLGILALGLRDDTRRRDLQQLVASVWDGNESWILLIAVGLWGGFPAVTGGLLPAVYPVLIVMLWALIARGVSIEMISGASGWPRWWGRLFMGGSLVAAFAQGVAIGAVVQGVSLGPGGRFTGGTFGFLTGFTVACGLATIVLYSVAGAALITMRSPDAGLRAVAARQGRRLVLVLVALAALVGGLIPVAGAPAPDAGHPLRIALLTWACVIAAVMAFLTWWSLGRDRHPAMAFTAVAVAEIAGVGGLLALYYPMILPPSLSIARAASPASSLDFLIGGFGMLIPITIAYNAYAFWVLRPRRQRAADPGLAPTGAHQ